MNIFGPGVYMATGKLMGKLPVPEGAKVAYEAAANGMVLLKNEGVLPMKPCKVALFGGGADYTGFCGTGSGFAFSPYTISVRQGLEEAGFIITSKPWLKKYGRVVKQAEKTARLTMLEKRFSGIQPVAPDPLITAEELKGAREAETAVYVLKRNTGENFDRKAEKGDYYLSDIEEENLRTLARTFPKTIVVLNTCVMDAALLESIPGISAIVLMGQGGLEAGRALADILTGKVTPSGKLTDTWAKRYEDYPAAKTFSANDGETLQEDYAEDIFVGYRHFDTAGLEVVYPFGYGLSYTRFAYENISAEADRQFVTLRLTVKNTGAYKGREVVQVYASAPAGRLPKPYQELKGFAKTRLLLPGEQETLTIQFPTDTLSSYDEGKAAYVMEAGDYILRVGTHSRSTRPAAILRLDEEAVTWQLTNLLTPDHPLPPVQYPAPGAESCQAPILHLRAKDLVPRDNRIRERHIVNYYPEGSEPPVLQRQFHFPIRCTEENRPVRPCPHSTLLDVADGKVTMEEFVASLDTETLLRIATGTGCETKYPVAPRLPKGKVKSKFNVSTSGKTTNQYAASLGIPAMAFADGPAGLHLMGSPSVTYPVGMVAAQNWDEKMIFSIGDCYGREMEHYHVAIALAPGINLHRDPLCGRNFEYYSEDPLLAGKTASAFTRGLQEKHPGYGVALKHFAANNQETDRFTTNATVSERALREIYLKGFEICVREAHPMTIMSSYNCLNGLHTSSRYDLLTDILRGEWGFEGFVMTDWDSASEKAFDFHAGNDIIMGGYPTDILAAAVTGKKPEFDADGSIHRSRISMYGGVMHRDVEAWNSFAPETGGKDTYSVTVAQGIQLGEGAKKALAEGYAQVQEEADGSRTLVYFGTNRGAYLPLGDLQRCAMRVLKVLMDNAPMKLARK